MRLVTPPRPVDVRRDEHWWPAQLEAWRRRGGRWEGFCRYTVGVGARHLGWVDQERLRAPELTQWH